MLIAAVVLFLLAAVCGLVILTAILQDRAPHHKALILHGSFAIVAIAIMAGYYIKFGGPHLLKISLILFVFAALGGLSLFLLGRKKPLPKWMVLVHPLVAVAAIITLLMCIL